MQDELASTPLEQAGEVEGVDSVPQNAAESATPVVVYTADSEEDGEIVRGILESEGVPAMVTHAASPALGQLFSVGEGQTGEVLVAPEDAERARDILSLTNASGLSEEQPAGE